MKIERNSPTRAVRSVAQSAYARRIEATGEVATVAPAAASVLGIPEAEFTPKGRAAVKGLMAEVDALRTDLPGAKPRLDELKKAPDQEGMLPLLNRRAFVRELTR